MTRPCNKCNIEKPFSEFGKKRNARYGISQTCKPCKSSIDKQYRLAHKEQVSAYHKQWVENNRETRNEISRRYWQKNKAKHQLLIQNRRAKYKGKYSKEEWNELIEKYNHKCLACNLQEPFDQFRTKLTVDHVLPIALGGCNDIKNIQPLCFNCNSLKKDKHVDYRDTVETICETHS